MAKTEKTSKRRRSFLPTLFSILLLLFVVTSGMVGFLLGKNTVGGTGALVDTIVISPEQSLASGRQEITHFLSGRVLTPQGDPRESVTVRLRETLQTDATDEKGKFFFSDVRTGEYTLDVLSDEKGLLASASVALEFAKGVTAQADLTAEGGASFRLPDHVRLLEVVLVLDEAGGVLSFREDGSCAVTSRGQVIDFEGKALTPKSQSVTVLPGGDVVTSGGYVVVPSKVTVVSPWGGVYRDETAAAPGAVPGVSLEEDGSVTLPNGVTVKPGGVVEAPEAPEPVGPTESVVVVVGGGAVEVPQLPEEYVPPKEDEPEGPTEEEESSGVESGEPSPAPSEASSEEGSESAETSAAEESAAGPSPSPTASPAPSPTPPPEEEGGNKGQAGGGAIPGTATEDTSRAEPTPGPFSTGIAWSQDSLVDLFANRTKGKELGFGSDGKTPIIAPGSAGTYNFVLKNTADYDIRFTLSISEKAFHLPILYSVRDLQTNYLYQGGSKVNSDGSAITTEYILLPHNSEREYQLGWEWQYEDWLTPWIDDPIDTSAAMGDSEDDRRYMVSLGIYAEQIYASSTGHGDGEDYPGFPGY